MKRFLFVSLFLCLYVSTAAPLEWREYGPPGATVVSMSEGTSPGIVYAFGRDQVYRSQDSGQSWQAMPQPPMEQGDYLVDGVVFGVTQETILALRGSKGVVRWDAASELWLEANNGITPPTPPYGWQFSGVTVADVTSVRVFVGASTGLFTSDTLGDSWNAISVNYSLETISAATDGSLYIASGSSQLTRPRRLESDLSTVTDFIMRPGLPQNRVVYGTILPSPNNPSELLFVESVDNKAYYSGDRGETWTSPTSGQVPETATTPAWLNGKPVVFAGTSAYSLNTQTQTWSLLWTRPIPDTYGAIASGDNALLLWGLQTNVWRSTNEGATWASSSSGMSSSGNVRAVAVAESSVYAGLSTSGVWRTRDDGKTWDNAIEGIVADPYYGISVRSLAVNPSNANNLLVATEETAGTGSLYVTTNGGDSWSQVTWASTSIVNDILFLPTQPATVLAALVGDGIWRSTNSGSSWTKVIGLPDVNNATSFTQATGGRVFCGVIGGFDYPNDYYYSDNAGLNWTRGSGVGLVKSLAADATQPNRVMAGTGWWGSGSGMYFTTDNGANWNAVNTGLPVSWGETYPEADSLVSVDARSGEYYLVMGGAVYQTRNEGASWTEVSDSAPVRANVLSYAPRKQGTLFCGTSANGLWITQLLENNWDLNDDGVVNSTDLLIMSLNWGALEGYQAQDLLRLLGQRD